MAGVLQSWGQEKPCFLPSTLGIPLSNNALKVHEEPLSGEATMSLLPFCSLGAPAESLQHLKPKTILPHSGLSPL